MEETQDNPNTDYDEAAKQLEALAASTSTPTETPIELPTETPKKRMGRPKGTKNKPKTPVIATLTPEDLMKIAVLTSATPIFLDKIFDTVGAHFDKRIEGAKEIWKLNPTELESLSTATNNVLLKYLPAWLLTVEGQLALAILMVVGVRALAMSAAPKKQLSEEDKLKLKLKEEAFAIAKAKAIPDGKTLTLTLAPVSKQ